MLRQLAKDAAIYGGTDFISKVIVFLAFPMLASALSSSVFGALELVLTATALLGLMANCGLNNAVQRYYWDSQTEPDQRPVLVSSGLAVLSLLVLLVSAVAGVALLCRIGLKEDVSFPISRIGISAAIVLMGAGQLVQYLLDVARLHMAPWTFAGITLVSRGLNSVVAVTVVVWLGSGVDGLIISQALVMLVAVPLSLWAVRKDITLKLNSGIVRELVQFGHPFVISGLAFWLLGAMDRWMLAKLSSLSEVGVYSIASRFSSLVLFVSTAFGLAWSPLAVKIRTNNQEEYRRVYGNVFIYFSLVMLLVAGGFSLFASEFIIVFLPNEYSGAVAPMIVLFFAVAIQAMQQVTAIGISLEKKTAMFARLAWFAVFVNLISNSILIPNYGAFGAALASLVAHTTLAFGYLYCTQKLHPMIINWSQFGCVVLIGLGLAACSVFFIAQSFDVVTLIIKLGVVTPFFIFAAWKLRVIFLKRL